jgi:hypothetical protein
MKRRYVDIEHYQSRNMAEDGNIDYCFWHDKTPEETSVAFREPDFFKKRVDRTIFSARKHQL